MLEARGERRPSVCGGAVDAHGGLQPARQLLHTRVSSARRSYPTPTSLCAWGFLWRVTGALLDQHHEFPQNCRREAHNGVARVHAPDIDRPRFW